MVDLLPRKEFLITLLNGQKITGKFGTWALKKFCTKKNYTLGQLSDSLSTRISIDDMVEFILSAVEQSFRELKSKDSFPYNDVDVCMWIDEMGGISSPEVTKIFTHASDNAEKKKSGEPLDWPQIERLFYAANPDPEVFHSSTFPEVLLIIQGLIDKQRLDRQNTYNLYCTWAGEQNRISIFDFLPLPYDYELKESSGQGAMTDAEIYDLVKSLNNNFDTPIVLNGRQ